LSGRVRSHSKIDSILIGGATGPTVNGIIGGSE